MQYSLKKLLGLQAFRVNGIKDEGKTLLFEVVSRRKTGDCPKCKIRSGKIHGYLTQKIKHIRVGQRLSYLTLTKRRFYCRHCKKTFVERINGIKFRNRISEEAKSQILSHLVDRSFKASSRQTGIGYHSQRRYLTEKVKPFLFDWSEELNDNRDISLGLDEISFSGHDMVRTITNITNKRLKAILPNDLQISLVKAIDLMPGLIIKRVKEVVIDMNGNSRAVIKQYLPKAIQYKNPGCFHCGIFIFIMTGYF